MSLELTQVHYNAYCDGHFDCYDSYSFSAGGVGNPVNYTFVDENQNGKIDRGDRVVSPVVDSKTGLETPIVIPFEKLKKDLKSELQAALDSFNLDAEITTFRNENMQNSGFCTMLSLYPSADEDNPFVIEELYRGGGMVVSRGGGGPEGVSRTRERQKSNSLCAVGSRVEYIGYYDRNRDGFDDEYHISCYSPPISGVHLRVTDWRYDGKIDSVGLLLKSGVFVHASFEYGGYSNNAMKMLNLGASEFLSKDQYPRCENVLHHY